MQVELRETAFEPLAELAHYQAHREGGAGRCGATVIFIGTMRDYNDAVSVRGMTLEHYPGMTEWHLQRITEQAAQEWRLLDGLVIHRVGALRPDDPIVLIAIWTAHRAEAFAACRFILEQLKAYAPFWKREDTATGPRWVEHNTPG